MKLAIIAATAALVVSPAHAQSAPSPAVEAGGLGVVSFENSGNGEAQAPFRRGLALLHNFEYERAAAEFRRAQAADPGFAMAVWGEAMTHNHPVWMEQDRDAARGVLAKLGPSAEARARRAGTERERDYLAAAEILYGEGAKEERDFRYEDVMAALHARYPDDVDAAAFHALSVLGTAHEGRDFAIYMRAAAILEEVFPEHRHHPGVLHYLIHSYDDPLHAPLGLRAARLYGAVAPDAGHALHMTTHIFVAMGMWDDVIAGNEKAIAVVNEQRLASGRGEVYCGHYPSWLVYGYLQRRKIDRARVYIDGCRGPALAELQARAADSPRPGPDPDNSPAGSYLWVRAMLAANTGLWTADDDVPLENASATERFQAAYGALLGANASGDRARLGAAAAELDSLAPPLLSDLDADGDTSGARRAAIEATRLQGEALVKLRSGDAEGGIAILWRAAEREERAPIEFGPPFVQKPSHELLGDELMLLGHALDAVSSYETALARTPGRTLAIDGLAKARRAADSRATR